MLTALKNHIDAFVSTELNNYIKKNIKTFSEEVVKVVNEKKNKLKASDIIDVFNKCYPDFKISSSKESKQHSKICTGVFSKGGPCKFHICDESDELCKKHYLASLKPKKEKQEKVFNKCKGIKKTDNQPCEKKCEGEYCTLHLKALAREAEKKDEKKEEKLPKPEKNAALGKYTFEHDSRVYVLNNVREKRIEGVFEGGKLCQLTKADQKLFKEKNWPYDEDKVADDEVVEKKKKTSSKNDSGKKSRKKEEKSKKANKK